MARSGRMRDMARRMRDRRRSMRDMARGRRDRMRGDYNYDMARDRSYSDSERSRRYDSTSYPDYNYSRYDMHYEPNREYYRHSSSGWDEPMMDYRGRRGYDMASGEDYLSDEELMEWSKDLIDEIEPQYKGLFEKNRVLQRGKEMGVKFKDYTEDEYVTTVLMIATDFGKTVGMNNIDQIYRMAVDWLEDKDSELQGSEKLAVYYDEIICAEE